MTDLLERVAQWLTIARSVVVLTGAGVSAESGIPTFRGAQGYWRGLDPQTLATPAAFTRDPILVQTWYRERIAIVRAAQPNAGHRALVDLAELVPTLIVTQNVDDLHERAGSPGVVHLHGRLDAARCATCDAPADLAMGEVPVACSACGSLIRPGVTWFGEPLDSDSLDRAAKASETADVFLSVGTSGLVYPAAALPGTAAMNGAFVTEVNPTPSAVAMTADVQLAGPSGVLLPQLVARVRTLMEVADA